MLTAVLWAGLAFAGDGVAPSLSGPRLGLIFDRAAETLRAISGIPGAAATSAPLPLGLRIEGAAISPSQDAALVVKARVASVALVRASGGAWVVTALDQVEAAPASMVFSPSGRAAALYYASGHVQIVTGLPAAPSAPVEIDVSGLPAPVAALAVDDAGSFLLVAAGPAESVSLYRAAANALPKLLASFLSVSSVRLFNASQRALVTDTLAGTVYEVTDLNGAGVTRVVASGRDGIQGLVAAETDAAGQRLFVADGDGTVFLFDLSGGPPSVLSCGCTPTGLFRLAGAATFRLTEPGPSLIEVLDANSAPRIVAVPPPAPVAVRKEVRQ
jgi:hypothetical protein